MSSDVSSWIGAGFVLSYADALRPFTFEQAEESHEEPRFDAKTGKPGAPERVVTREAGLYVKLPGSSQSWGPVVLGDGEDEEMGTPMQDGTEEFLEALGDMLECRVDEFGGPYCSYVGFNVVLQEDHIPDGSYEPTSRISAGAGICLSNMADIFGRAASLRRRMLKVGFKDEDINLPQVYNAVVEM